MILYFSAPKAIIEEPRGLSTEDVASLTTTLAKEAYSRRGNESIFELSQCVKDFLHKRNKPPTARISESFYETMMKNKQISEERRLEEVLKKEREIQEQLQNDILKRKEQLLRENRARRNTTSESSPRTSNSEDFRQEVCDEHRISESIYIPLTGRKIQRGACLGHSMKGCINYSGIDLASGQLVYITEWSFKVTDLEARGLKVDALIEEVERRVADLVKFRHKNLIAYEGVTCTRKKESLVILLFQEFLLGISLFSISGTIGWCPEGASMVAKGVLDGLIFLHNNGIVHGNILDSTVFMDNSGNIKLTDFSFVPFLQELMSGQQSSKDFPAFGTLLESLIPTSPLEMRNFINICKNEQFVNVLDLMEQPFLHPMVSNEHSQTPDDQKVLSMVPPRPVDIHMPFIVTSDSSRLESEFIEIGYIGKGAFGDVLKVRNKLDNRQYAIKRIPLSSKNKQLYKKMTREVELLSRLCHENVVRYFNSWVETQATPKTTSDDEEESELSSRGMVTTHSQNNLVADSSSDSDSSSAGWNNFMGNAGGDEDSDSIEFVDSKGQVVQYDEENSESDKKTKGSGDAWALRRTVFLYIQMEFCEKSTLRTAIDGNLYQDKERLWKLFREIVDGLSHIHQQGMIHRDLKPVNIFIDSKDHVKIGDFGLATTSVLALQHQQIDPNASQPNFGDSQTGQVGTALYVAPELSGQASKSTYNKKVDLYSLGIIFFEMCTKPLTTGMERIKTIAAIRLPEVKLPQEMDENSNEVKILKWLLDHNPNNRPTSEELLQSELLPPAKLEAYELQEMLRHVLANPQSRSYKHLIARCLAQESDQVSVEKALKSCQIFVILVILVKTRLYNFAI